MKRKIKLKPCPFCGREALMAHNKGGYYFAFCPNHRCVIAYAQQKWFEREDRAAEAWNRRVD